MLRCTNITWYLLTSLMSVQCDPVLHLYLSWLPQTCCVRSKLIKQTDVLCAPDKIACHVKVLDNAKCQMTLILDLRIILSVEYSKSYLLVSTQRYCVRRYWYNGKFFCETAMPRYVNAKGKQLISSVYTQSYMFCSHSFSQSQLHIDALSSR